MTTSYAYQKAGWGFSDNPDSSHDTWADFRGYNIVRVTDSQGTTEHRFHQGLHGERRTGGGTNSESVFLSTGGNGLVDQYWLRGRPYEVRRVNGAGAGFFSKEITTYTAPRTTGLTGRDDPRFVAPSLVRTWSTAGEEHRVQYTYNGWGQPTSIRDYGRWWNGSAQHTGDDQTTVIRYYPPNTSGNRRAWRGPTPCVTAVRPGLSAAAPATFNASGFVRYVKTYYDNSTDRTCTRATSRPIPTRTETFRWNTGRSVTRAALDSRGRVDRTWDGRGQLSQVFFDDVHGQVVRSRNPLGWESKVFYDAWRRPVRTEDVNGRNTLTAYDRYSRVVKVANPGDDLANPSVRVTYRQWARPASVQTQTKLTGNSYTNSASFFDGFGNQVSTRTLSPYSNESWVTSASYDARGRVSRTSAQFRVAGDAVTTFAYPSWGTVPSFTETTYDTLSRPYDVRTRKGVNGSISNVFIESYRYGAFRTSFYDQRRLRTDTYHEGRGRVTEVREVSAGNLRTRYGYNAADDLVRVTAPDGAVTTMAYDKQGRKVSMTDPDTGSWSYLYNNNSQMVRQTDPSGTQINFEYDVLGRMTKRKHGTALRAQWGYDPAGNRGAVAFSLSKNGGAGDVRRGYSYDSLGRVVREELRVPRPGTTGQWTFDTEYSYRADHQVSKVRYPVNPWGASGAEVSLTYNWRTGLPAKMSSATEGVLVDETRWKQTGQVVYRKFGAGGVRGVQLFDYDNHTLRLWQSRGGTVAAPGQWQRFQYSYDANGNVSRIRDLRNGDQRQCFRYDTLDRLTRAFTDNTNACDGYTARGAGNFNESYAYDAGGDLTGRWGSTNAGVYTYGKAGHVHAVTRTARGDRFDYDVDGNMVLRDVVGEPAQTLVWDVDQRLDEVRPAGGVETEFLYDADGVRVRRSTGSEWVFYFSGGEYERDGGVGVFRHYHSLGGVVVAFTETSGNVGGVTSWLWGDHLGSSSLMRDEGGTRRVQRYGSWGELRTDGNLTTDRAFTGQIADQATGLAFYNARYYDPTVGRFISPDTIVPNPLDGQDYNRYTYVRNNPVNYTDPTGHETCTENFDGSPTCWSEADMVGLNAQRDPAVEDHPYTNPENYSTTSTVRAPQRVNGQNLVLVSAPPKPAHVVNHSATADRASDRALKAEVASIGFAGLAISPCSGICAAASIGADAVGAMSSTQEIYAGLMAGEPDHVIAGTFSLATMGGSRGLTTAYDRSGLDSAAERGVIFLVIEAPAATARVIVSSGLSFFADAERRLIPQTRVG